MFRDEFVEGFEVVDFLIPHVADQGFKAGVIPEDSILAFIDKVCPEFPCLIYTDLERGYCVNG